MAFNANMLLEMFAACLFGGAVALLAYAAWALIQKNRAGRGGAQTSMRRADMRQAALQKSSFFAFMLPMIQGLAATVERLGLDPLRQYNHGPYVRAGYPGGLDDDEVVAAAILVSLASTLFLGFLILAFLG